jgi:hypothetical protein
VGGDFVLVIYPVRSPLFVLRRRKTNRNVKNTLIDAPTRRGIKASLLVTHNPAIRTKGNTATATHSLLPALSNRERGIGNFFRTNHIPGPRPGEYASGKLTDQREVR